MHLQYQFKNIENIYYARFYFINILTSNIDKMYRIKNCTCAIQCAWEPNKYINNYVRSYFSCNLIN